MRRTLLFLFLALAIVACTPVTPTSDQTLDQRLENPLYAEYYYDDLTDLLLTMSLREDSLFENEAVRETANSVRSQSVLNAHAAVKAQAGGRIGNFVSDREITYGEVLLIDDHLYFGPTFNSAPGAALSVYLTTLIDPRDTPEFPDNSAVYLGPLKDQYGAQSFVVPTLQEPTGTGAALRTAVLWDDDLGMLYGFAQLSLIPGNDD